MCSLVRCRCLFRRLHLDENPANHVFAGNELREVPDFHTEMEAKLKMNW